MTDITTWADNSPTLLADSVLERNGTFFQILAAVAIAGGGAAAGWWLKRRRDRRDITFDYRISSDVTVVSSHQKPERLRIMFGDYEVRNPFITEIEFRNTGRKAIEAEHFLSAIEIIRPDADILDFAVVQQSVDGLVPEGGLALNIAGDDEWVSIKPTTLNPNDCFLLQIVYDGDPASPPTITTRILNQSRHMQAIREPEALKRTLVVFQSLLAVGFGAGLFLLAAAFTDDARTLALPMAIIFVGLIATVMFLISIGETTALLSKWFRR